MHKMMEEFRDVHGICLCIAMGYTLTTEHLYVVWLTAG